jgi:RNA 2',3'-cyclic 3'-phosphodiesterase
MADQLRFGFYEDGPARPKRPERLFFAFFAGSEAAGQVGRLTGELLQAYGLSGKPLEPERLHVSLHHVGDFKRLPPQFVYAAQQAGGAVSMPPFELTFRSVASFAGVPSTRDRARGRPLVLLGEGQDVFELHGSLGAALQKYGVRAVADFTPHMTLLYDQRSVPTQAIAPIRLEVKGFALIHSELWLTRYNLLGHWALTA